MMATEKQARERFGHWLDSQSFICHFTQQLNTESIFLCISPSSLAITRFNILKRCYETQWNRLYNAPSGRAWMNIIPKRQHRGRQKKVNIRKGEADFSSLLPPKQQAAVIISRCLCSYLAVLNFHPSGFHFLLPYSLWLWPILSFRFPSNLFRFCGERFCAECAWKGAFAMKQNCGNFCERIGWFFRFLIFLWSFVRFNRPKPP